MKQSAKLAALTLLLLCGGCSTPSELDNQLSNRPQFTAPADQAKFFFYVIYDNPEDRPYFDQTFVLHTSNGDFEDINVDQYISTEMVPGSYNFNVEQISGFGNSLNHSSVTVPAPAGKPIFVAETVMHNGKIVLAAVPAARGEEEILTRKRKCLCQTALRRFWDSL